MILWKYLLTLNHQNQEKGFTLPLIIGFGLFMLSVSLVAIKMSSDSQVDSQTQERTYQALAAAEVGLTQLQEYLNRAPIVATVPDCNTRDASGDCTDSGSSEASWYNPDFSDIPPSESGSELCTQSSTIVVPDVIDNLAANNQVWTPVDPNNLDKGEYRLVSYASDGNLGQFPAVGTLVVDGRTREANRGVARLAVNIPIRKAIAQDEVTEPGLWMKFKADANLGSQFIRGSIMIENQTCAANDPNGGVPSQLVNRSPILEEVNPVTGESEATGKLLGTRREMPDTPALPPVLNAITEAAVFANVLPRTTDLAYEGAYHYLVPELTMAGNESINIADGQRAIFYVQGNIEFRGTINGLSSNSNSKNLEIYGNTNVATGTGYQGSSYKYGCYTAAAGACPTETIKIVGTSEISAFIHAPEAWACVTGSGSPVEANVTGAIWVNQWIATDDVLGAPSGMNNCTGTGGSKLVIDSVERDLVTGQLKSLIPDQVATNLLQPVTYDIPRISSSSSWQRQEVD